MSGINVFSRSQRWFFITGILLFFIPTLVNCYFLMPFPGSMDAETMSFSYRLDQVADFFLFASTPVVAWGCFVLLMNGKIAKKIGAGILLLLCCVFYYFSQMEYKAEKMFREPGIVSFQPAANAEISDNAYVLGVSDRGVSKAYPVKYLAYHHKVHDKLHDKDILVTYCSMCRSGRVFIPVVQDEKVTFRLVGARHYNAVMEDSKTGTWWYQATGEGATGPLKGSHLNEMPAEQTTWRAWKKKHPETLLLKPDPESISKYEDWFEGFDDMRSRPDTSESPKRIWVIALQIGNEAKAYSFPGLVKKKIIQDEAGKIPLVIAIEDDSLTVHVWSRKVNGEVLNFQADSWWKFITDQNGSVWNMQGVCEEGRDKGMRLEEITFYNEYLRSWQQFHPQTTVWRERDEN